MPGRWKRKRWLKEPLDISRLGQNVPSQFDVKKWIAITKEYYGMRQNPRRPKVRQLYDKYKKSIKNRDEDKRNSKSDMEDTMRTKIYNDGDKSDKCGDKRHRDKGRREIDGVRNDFGCKKHNNGHKKNNDGDNGNGGKRYIYNDGETIDRNGNKEVIKETCVTKEVKEDSMCTNRRNLSLTNSEKNTILKNGMLTDESINLAQNLLYKQFPEVGGFQDTVVCRANGFSVSKIDQTYIQILHTGEMHWICVASKAPRLKNNFVEVYDSLNSGKISPVVKSQIAKFCFSSDPEIRVEIKKVQQQNNGVDCGVFAIAFAVSLAFKEDPTLIVYNIGEMRNHLVDCIENGRMTPFPKRPMKRTKRCKTKILKISIFCNCRMPHDKDGTGNIDMAECSTCLTWIHESCEIIPNTIFGKRKGLLWECLECRKRKTE